MTPLKIVNDRYLYLKKPLQVDYKGREFILKPAGISYYDLDGFSVKAEDAKTGETLVARCEDVKDAILGAAYTACARYYQQKQFM